MASERGKLDPERGGQLRVEFEFEKTGRGNSQWKNVRDIPKKSLMVLKSERESSSGQEARVRDQQWSAFLKNRSPELSLAK